MICVRLLFLYADSDALIKCNNVFGLFSPSRFICLLNLFEIGRREKCQSQQLKCTATELMASGPWVCDNAPERNGKENNRQLKNLYVFVQSAVRYPSEMHCTGEVVRNCGYDFRHRLFPIRSSLVRFVKFIFNFRLGNVALGISMPLGHNYIGEGRKNEPLSDVVARIFGFCFGSSSTTDGGDIKWQSSIFNADWKCVRWTFFKCHRNSDAGSGELLGTKINRPTNFHAAQNYFSTDKKAIVPASLFFCSLSAPDLLCHRSKLVFPVEEKCLQIFICSMRVCVFRQLKAVQTNVPLRSVHVIINARDEFRLGLHVLTATNACGTSTFVFINFKRNAKTAYDIICRIASICSGCVM